MSWNQTFKISIISLIILFNFLQSYGLESDQSSSFRSAVKSDFQVLHDVSKCNLSSSLITEIRGYQPVANRIIQAATTGSFKGRTYEQLSKFVDKFGHRVAGSKSLEDSIDYMIEKMKKEDGVDLAWGEDALIPHWVRGEEKATLQEPIVKNIALLGLGNSVGTSNEGITAQLYVVSSFEELKNNTDKAKGKIVVYNQPFTSYGASVSYRTKGASEAARAGAVAALIRSIAPFSLDTPHTGGQDYDAGVNHIPAACITIEDAEWLHRYEKRGVNMTLHLKMLDFSLPLTTSRNAFGEITGKDNPEQKVIISGHIDSWDVGQGAMDDGGGVLISTEALALIRNLSLTPRRSIQAILWTAEEEGLWGAEDFIRKRSDVSNYIAAFESDSGVFDPLGLDFTGSEEAGCIVYEILKLTASINTTVYTMFEGSVSTDITVLTDQGVPGLSLNNANSEYFWYHHTQADTMSMMKEEYLDKALALWTVAAYVIADLSVPLPRKNSTINPIAL